MKEIYPKPSITVDIIVFDRLNDKLLLIKRKKDPYKDFWAFPGGFFNPEDHNNEKQDETLKLAAIRELKEETGIDISDPRINQTLTFLTIQDKPGRDPRGRTITIVYVLTLWDMTHVNVCAADDAAEAQWFNRSDLAGDKIPLAFDHKDEFNKFHRGITYL